VRHTKIKAILAVWGCFLLFYLPVGLRAQAINISDPNVGAGSGWIPLIISGVQNDYIADTNVGNGATALDIVGDATNPAVYYQFNSDATQIAVRMRVNTCDGPANAPRFNEFAYIGIDANYNGTIDFFIGAYNPTGTGGRLGIYLADPAAFNTGPGVTGISQWPTATFSPVAGVNYSMITAPGSNFSGNADYFITFVFNVADITTVITGITKENVTFTAATPITFIAGTSTQDLTLYGDVNGIDNLNGPYPSWWPVLFPHPVSVDRTSWSVVTFDKNGGDVEPFPQATPVKTGTGITQFPTRNPIKRNGWHFVGWSNIPNDGVPMTNPFVSGTIINADKTVYAIWEYTGVDEQLPEHVVHFDPSGGSWSGGAITYQHELSQDGSIKIMPQNPSPPAVNPGGNLIWIFGGWVTDSKVYNGLQGQTANMPNVVVVSGNVIGVGPIHYFLSSQLVTDLAKVNQNHGTSTVEPEYTVYALWLAIDRNITIRLSFYDNVPNDSVNPPVTAPPGTLVYVGSVGNSNNPAFSPAPITRQGFIFRGWDTNPNALPDAGGPTRYLDPLDPTKTITAWQAAQFTTPMNFYAIWDAKSYALQFQPNTVDYYLKPLVGAPSGTFGYVACPVDADGIKYPAFPAPPTLSTYKFIGWNTQMDGNGYFVDSTGIGTTISAGELVKFNLMTPLGDSVTLVNGARAYLNGFTTLYALWERTGGPVNTIVTFDAMGGTYNEGTPYYAPGDVARAHQLLDVPATDGYLSYLPAPVWQSGSGGTAPFVFAGWSFSNSPTRTVANIYPWISDSRFMVNGVTLYAVWEIARHNIIINHHLTMKLE